MRPSGDGQGDDLDVRIAEIIDGVMPQALWDADAASEGWKAVMVEVMSARDDPDPLPEQIERAARAWADAEIRWGQHLADWAGRLIREYLPRLRRIILRLGLITTARALERTHPTIAEADLHTEALTVIRQMLDDIGQRPPRPPGETRPLPTHPVV